MNKGNCQAYYEPEGLSHIDMVAYRPLLEQEQLRPHFNRGIEIIAPMRGCFNLSVEGKPLNLRPGEVSVTLPWQKHGGQGDAFNVGELCWIIINVDWAPGEDLELGTWSKLPRELVKELGSSWARASSPLKYKKHDTFKTLKTILHELQNKRSHYIWKVNRLIDDLFFDLHRNPPLEAPENHGEVSTARKLRDLLNQHLQHPWTVEGIAEKMHQSPSKLNRSLREETGYSTMELVTVNRLDQAKQLLLDSNLTITRIAHQCGFRTSQYFSSVFRKWMGLSPLQFREEERTKV